MGGLLDRDHLIGLHLTDVLGGESLTAETADPSDPVEARAVQNAMRYEYELGGYAMVQSTRPQSLGGMALTDSPVGGLLTCWWNGSRTGRPRRRIPRTCSPGTRC